MVVLLTNHAYGLALRKKSAYQLKFDGIHKCSKHLATFVKITRSSSKAKKERRICTPLAPYLDNTTGESQAYYNSS